MNNKDYKEYKKLYDEIIATANAIEIHMEYLTREIKDLRNNANLINELVEGKKKRKWRF